MNVKKKKETKKERRIKDRKKVERGELDIIFERMKSKKESKLQLELKSVKCEE